MTEKVNKCFRYVVQNIEDCRIKPEYQRFAIDVLSKDFVKDKKEKGAIMARYLEYLPVGPKALKDLILTGKNYYYMEKRRKEIIRDNEIYRQSTVQEKCTG